jgi:trimeric autotransporter adhesin
MIKMRSLPLCVLASVCFSSISALAQLAAPAIRIVNPVDDSQLVTLAHTVHPLANAANDRGVAPDNMRLDSMHLFLKRSSAQETALRQLIAQQTTPGSPSYHQWLTPAQFGAQFGASDQDISAIETWLGNHGFGVTGVSAGKGSVEFSGSVAQLRDAFHTQIHKYAVNGETHYANANDPQIPAALAPVIGGFASLNNFRLRSYAHKLGEATYNPTTHQVTPEWTQGTPGSVFYVLAPVDYAKQYDLAPLYTAGTNGSGQTIAIVNDSNININLVNQFRSLFGLPANPPQVIIDGNDPGVDGINNPDGPNFDSVEAYLDVEWAGAVAPNATIDLVVAADTSVENGLFLAMEHAVDANLAPVVSLSFGNCEANIGSTNAFINSLWQQAAAQGQTVMVSTGDNGSAGCDNDNTAEFAQGGQAVNGFASTPYNIAVGGTDFFYSNYNNAAALNTQLATYWNATPSQLPAVSLLQTIPEQPWNNSQYGLNAVSYYQQSSNTATTIAAASGGASNAAICSTNTYNATTGACTGTLSGYPKPSWQTGTGVPADGVRDLPDVSLFAANGYNYSFIPICAVDADCQQPSGSNLVQISGVGGTSASAPSFAGIMALVNQKYGMQGQADVILYPLKAQFPAAFHDVANGTISVPCEFSPSLSPNCISANGNAIAVSGVTEGQIGASTTPEYNAAAGYNLATGLGTVDANALVTNWNKITLATSKTTLTPLQTSFAHGTKITVSGSVTGTGTPSGNVTLMTDSTEPLEQSQGVFALSSGAFSNANVNYLPGGTYNIWGQYGGDGTNGISASAKTQITVTPETPGMNFNLFAPSATNGYYTSSSGPGTQVDYGTQLMLGAEVAPTSQLSNLETCVTTSNCSSLGTYTNPTGAVTFSDNGTAINTAVINAEGDAEYNAPFAVGSHSVDAAYSGDQSYNKITASTLSPKVGPITFTVVKDSPVMGVDAANETSQGAIVATQPTVFNVIVENGIQYNTCSPSPSTGACTGALAPVPVLPPTGTVAVTSSPSGISGTVTLNSGVDPSDGAQAGIGTLTIPASTLTASAYTVSLVYSGDSNYQGNAGNPIMQAFSVVTGGVASTTAATMTGSISPNTNITINGTVTGKSGNPAPTGAIILFTSGNGLAEFAVSPPSSGVVSTFSFQINSQHLAQGANFITLQYTGDSVYSPSAVTLNSGNSISNPLADFTLIPNTTIVPISISGGAGSGTDTINVASVNGFTGTVGMGCSATLPLYCSVSPNPSLSSNSSATSTLTINIPSGSANGNYDVSVTGKDSTGEFIHTLGITANVTGEPTTPNFALTPGGSITVAQGATTGNTSTITVTPANGFTGNVTLSCTVAGPSGATSPVTCGVTSPLNVTGTTSATVTATSTSTTTTGAYVITVTATSGSITQTATVNVSVNSAAVPAYTLAASSPSGAIAPGSSASSTVSVTGSGGYAGSVTLTCAMTAGPTNQSGDAPTCSISTGSPVSLSSTTTSGTATATVTTVAATAGLAYPKFDNGKGWLGAGSGAILALLVFFGIPARRRSWRSMLGIFIAMAALGFMAGCGGGGSGGGGGGGGTNPSNPGTAAGTYTFTVTSTATATSTPAANSPTFTVSVN